MFNRITQIWKIVKSLTPKMRCLVLFIIIMSSNKKEFYLRKKIFPKRVCRQRPYYRSVDGTTDHRHFLSAHTSKTFSASTFQHFLLPSTNQHHGPSIDLHSVNDLRSSILSGFFKLRTGTTFSYHRRLAMTMRWWIDGSSLLLLTLNWSDFVDLISIFRPSVNDHHLRTVTGSTVRR